ncbi:hypothetical protein [Streptomyces sp. NBC_00576]|uniref:hypothetical protein n=1 Tax=Streptomyces sp. NBC_00576 TaxID=2903665 RepID=UPI002E806B6A|nr:hypothetical protein [Streptomyces sp. NBC_00576]WUB76758.1 hypothetical protein OG734_45705 [Streptomyces sp. NBC_00576]
MNDTDVTSVGAERGPACTAWTASAMPPEDVSMAALADVEALMACASAHARR